MLAWKPLVIVSVVPLLWISGCASPKAAHIATHPPIEVRCASPSGQVSLSASDETGSITQVGYDVELKSDGNTVSTLSELESIAIRQNPLLAKLYQRFQASSNHAQYADKLPDPKFGANVFGNPLETASGSQKANFNISQAIPWLGRLSAEQQQAFFEAHAARADYATARLDVVTKLRVEWYRLYVIEKQIETITANQQLLQSLIDVANARISTGNATQGDVLAGTLEFSRLEERLLKSYQRRTAVVANINRLLARPSDTPVTIPQEILPEVIGQSEEDLFQIAVASQPEIEAARLMTHASRWGIEIARLKKRPEFMISANYFLTDDNRPASTVVDVGEDPWAIGAQVSIPIWKKKYEAIRHEAGWKYLAQQSSLQEMLDRYEAAIADAYSEAERAFETVTLYESTIIPQAKQTLTADQDAYSNGAVEFDRVIRDYQSLLNSEIGYYQAVGELSIANARLQQLAGRNVVTIPPVPAE
ncbi:TolC family protein [Calycomorphotria hydatis]|uniref:Outer membrane efflux protein n=1 Tax=Calycomorphotria hydatis TaxID=2528027 RepID=A0A517TE53_9PLAN|nr:TolC family protein [Calycomorphotria hydatis]QDT66646.1 Outer membrane efflux protein [Calycomorphotria hydatis]